MRQTTANGHRPNTGLDALDTRAEDVPIRLVVFGESIVSDWDNPAATSWRSLLRALTAAGHEAVFFEQRRNRATVDLLRARGAEPIRAFAARYPDVHYRSYDLPRGIERSVWFGREMATLDAVVVLDTAPAEILAEIAGYDTPKLLRVLALTGQPAEGPPPARLDLLLAPNAANDPDSVALGPVVEVAPAASDAPPVSERDGILVVAYDAPAAASVLAAELATVAPRLVTPGNLPEPWPFVPEVDLPDLYRSAAAAVVLPAEPDRATPFAAARVALALAAGCPVVVPAAFAPLVAGLPVEFAAPGAVAVAVDRVRRRPAPSLPDAYHADLAADRLVQTARRMRLARMARMSG